MFPLRHLIYSVVKIPRNAKPRLKFTLNCVTFFDFLRTFYGLLLLCFSRNRKPITNAEALIHLWYSARLPDYLYAHVQNSREDLQKHLVPRLCSTAFPEHASGETQTFGWEQRNVRLTGTLSTEQSDGLKQSLEAKPSFSPADEIRVRIADRLENLSRYREAAAPMTRSRALGMSRWRADGLLLPYGHPRKDFNVPNPYDCHMSMKKKINEIC